MTTKLLEIDDIKLHVLEGNKGDAPWYSQRKAFEERYSLLYPLLQKEKISAFLDVGANYGFVSLLARKFLPNARIISIEADPRLAPLIAQNFELNGLNQPELLNLIAGAKEADDSSFSLNPNSSLDNRVSYPGWQQLTVPTRTVGSILEEQSVAGPVFIKIDTQGYETKVLAGMEQWLLARRDWHVKMEFAPNWLESQQHNPLQ